MESSNVNLMLNNVKMYNKLKRLNKKIDNLEISNAQNMSDVKSLVIEYRKALEIKTEECELLKKENEKLHEDLKHIPGFIKNFFEN